MAVVPPLDGKVALLQIRIIHSLVAPLGSLLQNDVRIPSKELAARVGLAPSSCHQRVKRLWSEGVLKRGRRAEIPLLLRL
ncbi:MAG: winged helix-turn-helix transcriptional regulator [Reyranellaceae bacterium]